VSANCHVLAQVTTTDGVQSFGYVVELQQTFVTAVSEATLRNIELGVLMNYEPLVTRLSAYFDGLIAGVTCLNIRCIAGMRAVSLDLFVVRTIAFKLLYGLVILRHARRRSGSASLPIRLLSGSQVR
jgi:hypothetical protein